MTQELAASIGLAAQDALGAANYKLLVEFDVYLQLFGNILTPGTLHLCPDNANVRVAPPSRRMPFTLLSDAAFRRC